MAGKDALRLYAQDREDLAIISAFLQDAVTRPVDLTYLDRQHTFAGVFSRYRWEAQAGGRGKRVFTGIHFRGVLRVQTHKMPPPDSEEILELLAIHTQNAEDGGVRMTLLFAGGGSIRLEAECIECELSDLTTPWRATGRPNHSASDAD